MSSTDISQIKEGGVKMKPELRGFGLKTTTGRGTCSTVPSPTDISQIIERVKRFRRPRKMMKAAIDTGSVGGGGYTIGYHAALDKVLTYLESLKK